MDAGVGAVLVVTGGAPVLALASVLGAWVRRRVQARVTAARVRTVMAEHAPEFLAAARHAAAPAPVRPLAPVNPPTGRGRQCVDGSTARRAFPSLERGGPSTHTPRHRRVAS